MVVPDRRLSRRRLMSAGAVGAGVSVSGCLDWFETATDGASIDQIQLTIKTLPSDEDVYATKIASHLSQNLRKAGIDAVHEPVTEMELLRDVFVHGDYDLFVLRHPGFEEYDALRGLLHSDFLAEHGWQNPFHFSSATIDEFLDIQRTRSGTGRSATLTDLFESLEFRTPYTSVVFHDSIAIAHDSLDVDVPPRRTVDYFRLLDRFASDPERENPLTIGRVDFSLLQRANPIAIGRYGLGWPLSAIYDALVRPIDGEDIHWLAESISWSGSDSNGAIEAIVVIPEATTWHDGEDLDAADIAFSYQFYQDTSMGSAEQSIPAPRFRSRSSIIDDVTVFESNMVKFSFGTSNRSIARRSLTLPILPEHIWSEYTEPIDAFQTEAFTLENEFPIGSGPLALTEEISNDGLTLEPFEDHVLFDDELTIDVFDSEGISLDSSVELERFPNTGAAIDALLDEEIHLISTSIPPESIDIIESADDAMLLTRNTDSFYMIGYNMRQSDLANPRFRQLVSRLIDREHVAESFFDGFAVVPSTNREMVGVRTEDDAAEAIDLQFPGEDGEVDVSRIRELFQEIGYRYDDDELVTP